MSREKESYRENLQMLLEAFPDKKLLTSAEVARWTGRDRRFIKKEYFGEKKMITLPELASRIS